MAEREGLKKTQLTIEKGERGSAASFKGQPLGYVAPGNKNRAEALGRILTKIKL